MEKPPERPVSLRDIAKRANVSIMTVSLSLRDHTSISKATRTRVRKIAAEMGYERDPLLSAYGRQIRKRTPRSFHSTLAWLNDWESRDTYQRVPWLRRYWEGARERAKELGFALDPVWLREKGMHADRLHSILQSRGIRGFIVHQLLHPDFFKDFPISAYASASIGQNELSHSVPRVLPDATANALISLEEIVSRGYRRIGFFQNVYHTAQTQAEGVSAAFFNAFRLTGTAPILPFFTHGEASPDGPVVEDFRKWFSENRPDVILTENDNLLQLVAAIGLTVPKDVGIAHLEITDPTPRWSGIDPLPEALGAAAIDLVAGQLFRNELGARQPEESFRLIGRWTEGSTLCPAKTKAGGTGGAPPTNRLFSHSYFRDSLCLEPRVSPLSIAPAPAKKSGK